MEVCGWSVRWSVGWLDCNKEFVEQTTSYSVWQIAVKLDNLRSAASVDVFDTFFSTGWFTAQSYMPRDIDWRWWWFAVLLVIFIDNYG